MPTPPDPLAPLAAMPQREDLERLLVAVRYMVAKAAELDQPLDIFAQVMIDQGTRLLIEQKGRDAAAVWLEATLADVKAKAFETTGVGRA